MFNIVFTDLGRTKWDGSIETDMETLEDAENVALLECRKLLASKYIMLTHQSNLFYQVTTGIDTVGHVKIRSAN